MAHWLGDAGVAATIATERAVTASAGPAILVVDDDPGQRLLLAAILEKQGYRVSVASNGASAMEWIHTGEECALVLTDLDMPGMPGDALLRKLRGDPRTATLPIIVLSGSDEPHRESELIASGADDYLRKPVDPLRLIARVRALLRPSSRS